MSFSSKNKWEMVFDPYHNVYTYMRKELPSPVLLYSKREPAFFLKH